MRLMPLYGHCIQFYSVSVKYIFDLFRVQCVSVIENACLYRNDSKIIKTKAKTTSSFQWQKWSSFNRSVWVVTKVSMNRIHCYFPMIVSLWISCYATIVLYAVRILHASYYIITMNVNFLCVRFICFFPLLMRMRLHMYVCVNLRAVVHSTIFFLSGIVNVLLSGEYI